MTTLDDLMAMIRGVEAMLNDFHSENKSKFSKLLEGQRELYRFLGVPVDDGEAALPPVNQIFKRYHDRHPINFARLHGLIASRFVCRIRYVYEWFALWKVFYELRLLENTTLTAFARQMFLWYPDAPKTCQADSIGDYSSGYLGQTPSVLWDEQAYIKNIKGNQSRAAYKRIRLWTDELREMLRITLRIS
jgi:hypothetical protein